jgi:CheY-like chemotaxis protein
MRAFKAAGMAGPVSHVEDGQQAIDYLSGKNSFADRARFPLPALVLLDIKLPFMSGFEVLRWIREQSNFPKLPVIMLTSSNQECDIERAYAFGANAYLVKPSHGDRYDDLAALIKRFWLDANCPPPQKPQTVKASAANLPLRERPAL